MKAKEIKDIIVIEVPHQRPVSYHIHDDIKDAKSHDYHDLHTVQFYTLPEAAKALLNEAETLNQHQGTGILYRLKDAVREVLAGIGADEVHLGQTEDDGYMHHTHNLSVHRYKLGELDLINVQNNADLNEWAAIASGESTQSYLENWDEEYQADFRAEGLLPDKD